MKQYTMSDITINEICKAAKEFYENASVAHKEALRLSLMVEETLLNYRERFGDGIKIELHTTERFNKASIQILVFCPEYNPFNEPGEFGILRSLFIDASKNNPVWKHRSSPKLLKDTMGVNELIFSAAKATRIGLFGKLLVFSTIGVLSAIFLRSLLTPEQCGELVTNYFQPIASSYTGILSVMAILMVFFSMPLCLSEFGSAAVFQKTAKRLLISFAAIAVACVLITTIPAFFLNGLSDADLSGGTLIKPIVDIVIGFIPDSLLGGFLSFNCMQVMIIGACFGFSFLVMGDNSKELLNLFDKCNYAAVLTNGFFARFVHYYVGLTVFCFFMGDLSVSVSEVLVSVSGVVGFSLLLMAILSALMCRKLHISLRKLVQIFRPSFLINLGSASLGAAFMDAFNEINRDCNVNLAYTSMGCNLGTVFFKPIYGVYLALTSIFFAYQGGILSVPLIFEIMILACVLPVIIPNIQGGAVSVIVLMATQLGIADSAVEMMISLNVLLQFIIIPVNIFCMQCVTVLCAEKDGQIEGPVK